MSKRAFAGIAVCVFLLATLAIGVFATDWNDVQKDGAILYGDSPEPIETGTGQHPDIVVDDGDGKHVKAGSLNAVLFEDYGVLLIVLSLLMFGAMVAGVCIAKEEVEKE